MTESLRERCIEAGARQMNIDGWTCEGHEPGAWCQVCKKIQPRTAERILDAVLDVLEESADEWIDEEWDRQVARWSGATRDDVKRITSKHKLLPLLSVLRGNGE